MTDYQTDAGVEVTDRGPFIGTYLRSRFYPFDPRPEEVYLEDIAQSLSMICRFNGHIDRFYSVAEHSVYMSRLATNDLDKKWCLLHDATEAYVGDMIRPLKKQMKQFEDVEELVFKVIAEKFGLPPELSAEVHRLDNVLCSTEKRDLIPYGEPWAFMPDPSPALIIRQKNVYPEEAKEMFLDRFNELSKGEQ